MESKKYILLENNPYMQLDTIVELLLMKRLPYLERNEHWYK